ncbi:UDP glycosyltransferase [Catellatospora methionotrophica]|uniref:UDP glycosyltransferase n=1 Tax=Catellatospora methionotrophica TaxID=121620 RepID=A0A8J3LE29_9ACTN|nr:macrolide family glycosyltransferase [Catellatospora methionotrophica]GIG16934.1 UDP glycosyltransferase [Catellatospora methionotrophica]
MGRHIAFVNAPTVGEVYPTLPIVTELIRRGHRVSYATVAARAEAVAATGATVLPYLSGLPAESNRDLRRPERADYITTVREAFLDEARATLPQLAPYFRDDRPDLMVFGMQSLAGRLIAIGEQLPAVQFQSFQAANEHWSIARHLGLTVTPRPGMPEHQVQLDTFAAAHGVDPDAVRAFQPLAQLLLYPRFMQFRAETFSGRHHFTGPCTGPRPFQARWTPPDPGRPVVLVSLGTVYNRLPGFYRTCVEAFTGSPWQAVLAVGERTDPAELGPLPANVTVAATVPQLDVLAHAAAFVTHAGMGGILEAIHAGVPMLTVPQTPEQEVNAQRVAELGAGHPLAPTATAAALRTAVENLTTDQGVRQALTRLQTELRAYPGTPLAAALIESALP